MFPDLSHIPAALLYSLALLLFQLRLMQLSPQGDSSGFLSQQKGSLQLESLESVALKGLLTRRNRKMSLADGNHFHVKCHLLMIVPFATAASNT